MDAVILTHNIDQPFIQQIEQDNEKLAFLRIDADISDSLKSEGSEKELKEDEETLSKLFKKVHSTSAIRSLNSFLSTRRARRLRSSANSFMIWQCFHTDLCHPRP